MSKMMAIWARHNICGI